MLRNRAAEARAARPQCTPRRGMLPGEARCGGILREALVRLAGDARRFLPVAGEPDHRVLGLERNTAGAGVRIMLPWQQSQSHHQPPLKTLFHRHPSDPPEAWEPQREPSSGVLLSTAGILSITHNFGDGRQGTMETAPCSQAGPPTHPGTNWPQHPSFSLKLSHPTLDTNKAE